MQTHLSKQLVGDAVEVNGRMIQPLAQMTGRYFARANGANGFAGAWIRMEPRTVIARDANGNEQRVPIFDATARTIRTITIIALSFAVASALFTLLIRKFAIEQ